MKYATWILNFADPKYGTGPEASIAETGGTAQAAFAEGDITQGARILGYYTGEPTDLEAWSFTELTEQEALDFVLTLDPTAYLLEGGRIGIIYEEIY